MAIAAPQLVAWILAGGVGAAGVGVAAGVINVDRLIAAISPSAEVVVEKKTEIAALPKNKTTEEQPATKSNPVKPSFDIVRVEKDGSLLIAGNAEPQSIVEVLIAGKVAATAKAGANGDFVIIFDEPLQAGDHELLLRSNSALSGVIEAIEAGLISIPKDKSGELLAMVTKPGAASRVMQAPATVKPDEAVKVEPVETMPNKVVEVPVMKKKAPAVAAQPEESIKSAETEVAVVEPPKIPVVEAMVEPEAEEKAAAIAEPKAEPKKPVEAISINVAVEAVEVEGNRVYIAGSVNPGTRVAIYIDGKYVGSDTGTPNGRFVVEAEKPITPGNHSVRADVLLGDSVTVAARAEVPFIHEPEPEIKIAVVPESPKIEPKPEPAPEAKVEAAAEPVTPEPKSAAPAEKIVEVAKVEVPAEPKPVAVEPEKPKPAAIVEKPSAEPEVKIAATEITPAIVPTKEQAPAVVPLRTGSSVIIRRGDSLWRISRRTYGRGIRYSTIYLANIDQVRNPHRIWPGQILKIPKNSQ